MKLISCEVENFGVLHEERRVFGDGWNVLCAPNGTGKSTLAVFIKAMLYGLPATTKTSVTENERKHYRPWQGGIYGGTLTIECRGKRYRIERTFGQKETEDSFRLIDLSTNLPSADYSENIGFELFGIGADAYERSAYIAQRPSNQKAANTDLQTKLSNLLEESGDLSSYDDAIKRLDQCRQRYRMTGNRGLIAELEAKQIQNEGDLHRCRTKCTKAEETAERLRETCELRDKEEEKLKRHEARLAIAAKRQAASAFREQYREMQTHLQDDTRTLSERDAFFRGRVPSASEMAQLGEDERKLYVLREQRRALEIPSVDREACEQLRVRLGEISDELTEEDAFRTAQEHDALVQDCRAETARLCLLEKWNLQQAETVKHAKSRFPLVVFLFVTAGILLVTGGFLLGYRMPLWAIAAGGAAVLCALCAVLLGSRNGKQGTDVLPENDADADIHQLREALARKQVRILETETLLNRYLHTAPADGLYLPVVRVRAADVSEYETRRSRLEEAERKCAELEVQADALQDSMCQTLSAWYDLDTDDIRSFVMDLQSRVNAYVALQATIEKEKTALAVLVSEHPEAQTEPDSSPEEGEAGLPSDVEGLEGERQEVLASLERRRNLIAFLEEERRQLSGAEEELADLEVERDRIASELEDAREKLQLVLETAEYLQKAKESLSSRYLDRMQAGFRRYFAMLTGDDAERLEMNTSFEVKVRAAGKQYDTEYLSRGYRDIVTLCTRFALVDALYEDERPFLVLDDPLINLDDEKCALARKLLEEIAKHTQILYLVCSKSRT